MSEGASSGPREGDGGRAELQRVRRLREALADLQHGLPLQELLQRLVEKACELTGARYGALAVLEAGTTEVSRFLYAGMREEVATRIGRCPIGRGVLEELVVVGEPLRLADLSKHPRSIGFPTHHPRMTSFLGVPLRLGGEIFGNLYLCDKQQGGTFSEDDERMLVLLGAESSLAIGYARRLEEVEAAHSSLEAVREELAAVVAHDLRNPISAILLHVESLSRLPSLAGDRVAVPRSALDAIRRSGQRMAQMAADLSDASQVELGRLRIDPRPLVVGDEIGAILARLAPTLAGRRLDVDVDEDLPKVRADALRFDQILTNLVENAAKYSRPGGPIRVLARRSGDGVTITVEDEGAGIAPDDVPRLFDRYYQTKRARETKSGLGLGLYITKGLVEAHGGRITVDSAKGKGSRFQVWLPSE